MSYDTQVVRSPFSRQLHLIGPAQLHNLMKLNFRLIDISFNNRKGLETKEVQYT